MRGICLINEKLSIAESKQESAVFQLTAMKKFFGDQGMQEMVLNPYQLNNYYTIPHALLFDLKTKNVQLDFLIIYSMESILEFIELYPAKWVLLKSYFNRVIILVNEEKRYCLINMN